MRSAAERAQRLVRWYPAVWRDRYGEEFVELLEDDLNERPQCWRRDVDVIQGGVIARLSAAGLGNGPVRSDRSIRAAIATAVVLFAAATTSIWTQLIGGTIVRSQGVGPDRSSLIVLSLAAVALLVIAMNAGWRIARTALAAARTGDGGRLVAPTAQLVIGATTFIVGDVLISGRWPWLPAAKATSSHIAEVGRFSWAATDSISSYWIHPAQLVALPLSELAWMIISPITVIVACRGLLQLCSWLPKLERPSGSLLAAGFGTALVVSAAWVIGSQHAVAPSLRAGTLDVALLIAMTVAFATLARARFRSAEAC